MSALAIGLRTFKVRSVCRVRWPLTWREVVQRPTRRSIAWQHHTRTTQAGKWRRPKEIREDKCGPKNEEKTKKEREEANIEKIENKTSKKRKNKTMGFL